MQQPLNAPGPVFLWIEDICILFYLKLFVIYIDIEAYDGWRWSVGTGSGGCLLPHFVRIKMRKFQTLRGNYLIWKSYINALLTGWCCRYQLTYPITLAPPNVWKSNDDHHSHLKLDLPLNIRYIVLRGIISEKFPYLSNTIIKFRGGLRTLHLLLKGNTTQVTELGFYLL